MHKSPLNQISNWQELAQQTNWSARKLASKCGISERTLHRFWLYKTGVSPREWLGELRQRLALELLREGTSIKETAYYLGYKQPNNFARKFKDYWGFSPSMNKPILECRPKGEAPCLGRGGEN